MARKKVKSSIALCPYCNAKAKRSLLSDVTGKPEHAQEIIYLCGNYPACDAYVMANKQTGAPLGTLANRKLRSLRQTAHKWIYLLQRDGYMEKKEIYSWLSAVLQIPMESCHLSEMQEYNCTRVIELTQNAYQQYQSRRDRKRAEREKKN